MSEMAVVLNVAYTQRGHLHWGKAPKRPQQDPKWLGDSKWGHPCTAGWVPYPILALTALSSLLASQSSSSPVLNKQEGPVQAHTSLFIMYFITSESSFVRCGWRRPFYGCVAGCLTWGSGTQAASCFISCILVAVDPVSLHGMRNCPSITIVRAWWYLDIIRSAEAPVNRVSINVWWWSTLINQRRLVGRLPGSEE